MSRFKALSLPAISLLAPWIVTPIHAQTTFFSVETNKTFRQTGATSSVFMEGNLQMLMSDGQAVFEAGCARDAYWPPGIALDPCPLGSSGFWSRNSFGLPAPVNPYLSIISISQSQIIEPGLPDIPHLSAAPVSKLPRPLYGFTDNSFSAFYNLHQESTIQEYRVTSYDYSRDYSFGENDRMSKEIVPGTYSFKFPRRNLPATTVTLGATIRNLPDGYQKLNRRFTGVRFSTGLGFDPDGFMRVSFNTPTTFTWSGIATTQVSANTDRLYFSLRYLAEPTDSMSDVSLINPITGASPSSLFPGFSVNTDPRITLATPFVTSYSLPPIFQLGTTAVAQLELERIVSSNGVVFDTSSRTYQIPIRFSSLYTDFATISFGSSKKKVGILDDFDGDGFDNLTEWVLTSRAQDQNSVPAAPPRPVAVAAVRDTTVTPAVIITPAYFGFDVPTPLGNQPPVVRTLERRISATAPWLPMVTDANWTVTYNEGVNITVRSRTGTVATPTQPPNTATHQYRVVVTLAPPAP